MSLCVTCQGTWSTGDTYDWLQNDLEKKKKYMFSYNDLGRKKIIYVTYIGSES